MFYGFTYTSLAFVFIYLKVIKEVESMSSLQISMFVSYFFHKSVQVCYHWLKAICKCAVVHISTWKPVKSLNRETLTGSGWFLPNSCWLLVGSLWVSGCFWLVPGVFWLVLVGLCFFNLWHMLKKCLLSIVTYHTKYFFVMHVLNRKKTDWNINEKLHLS